jgi:hypothetical protein
MISKTSQSPLTFATLLSTDPWSVFQKNTTLWFSGDAIGGGGVVRAK